MFFVFFQEEVNFTPECKQISGNIFHDLKLFFNLNTKQYTLRPTDTVSGRSWLPIYPDLFTIFNERLHLSQNITWTCKFSMQKLIKIIIRAKS